MAVADLFTGMYAASAIVAALFHRERTGVGQHIDLALLDAQVAMLANLSAAYLASGRVPGRMGNAHQAIVPYQVFRASDAFLIIAVGNDAQFARFCAVAGLEALASDPRYATNPARVSHRDELVAIIAGRLATRPAAQWLAELEAAQVPCGPINDLAQVFEDRQVIHRGMVATLAHPEAGEVRVVANPVRFSATPARSELAPPLLGQHTARDPRGGAGHGRRGDRRPSRRARSFEYFQRGVFGAGARAGILPDLREPPAISTGPGAKPNATGSAGESLRAAQEKRLKPTDIGSPDYFHKVVDCQWACPAHTPVPEYIRLIAQGRYSDAYMVNWKSNVFPGILGRTCDRPCEPACRRGRVEENQGEKPEPVAICRLKRVAADYKDDIRERLPKPAARKNGKRVACVGGGPASLTVARDLAPLGYHVTIFDADRRAGGMIRTQIPKFRLPESVIDEEVGYILDLDVDFRPNHRVESLKELLGHGYDAVFVGSGAPRGRDLDVPGREEAAKHIHVGIEWLASVSFGHITKVGRRVIVLGGGNTAMDCCRSARRLGGEDVKVIVRSGFEEMKASPWEKEDAVHEGIPILNFLVPKAFVHDGGRLTGMTFEKVKAVYDDKGRRSLVPTGEPEQHFECDEVLVAVGQENAFPWIERDCGLEFDKWGHAGPRPGDAAVDAAERVLRRRRGARAQEHHLGGRPRPRGGHLDRPVLPGRGRGRAPAAPHEPRVAEDGHPRVELRQPDRSRREEPGAAQGAHHRAQGHPPGGGAGLRSRARLEGGAALPQLRRADGVRAEAVHRVRRLRGHLPDGLHHLHRRRRGGRGARAPQRPGAQRRAGPLRGRRAQDRAASWPRTRTCACTAACAPSAARRAPGTCRSSSSR